MADRGAPLLDARAGTLPVVRTLRTGDFDRMAEAFVEWRHRFEQLSPGAFRGRVVFVHLGDAQLFDVDVNRAVRATGDRSPEMFTFSPILPSNADALWRGRRLARGMVNVLGPAQEMDHRTTPGYRNTSLSVHQALLRRACTGLVGVDLDDLIGPGAPLLPRALLASLVRQWRDRISAMAAGPVDRPGSEGLALTTGLVRALAAGRVADPIRATAGQRRRAVQEVEDRVRAEPAAGVTLLDLCEWTGLSERSLHYAFLEVTGLTPKAYLKAIRLNLARSEIRRSRAGRGEVGLIARRYGFERPGNFAADYRRLFGTLPSRDPRDD